jgi:DNA topoisomerase I
MAKSLIIVESPTKAKTIKKFLGKEYEVKASFGHVRDLPNNASEIPAKYKKTAWAKLGVNIEKDFDPLYIIPDDKKKRVKDLKDSLVGVEELLLATDEDREGESISWHLLQVLNPKVPVKRLVFHEITKAAIQKALNSTRNIDENLVKAQETRRVVDRLFGYTVSPLLWKKMAPKLSAGRVQSVALRLLVERERERVLFKKGSYWDLKGVFSSASSETPFDTDLTHVDGKRLALGRDFDPLTGKVPTTADVLLLDESEANKLKKELSKEKILVESIDEKPFTQKPYAPFTTSTLQQEASRKFGFGAKRTMQVAQVLYENGYITYMRTDSTSLSEEAIKAARSLILQQYGDSFLPEAPRIYKTSVKNAQEAHEAIRPAGEEFLSIDVVKAALGVEAGKLYELIWKRALASQMNDAQGTRIAARFKCGRGQFRASGKTIKFAGFLRAYVEGSDDPEAELADKEKMLPVMKVGEELLMKDLKTVGHETQSPARYTEGALIKELERLGIGRPSTWATIVDVVLSRTYAFKKGTALVPTFLAMAVVGLIENHLGIVINYDFTARLESDLDGIARGELDNLNYLKGFYLGESPGLEKLVKHGEETIDPRIVCGIPIFTDETTKLEVRIGRYGPFLTDGENRASLPTELAPDELNPEIARKLIEDASREPESLGEHPETGKPIFLKTGRYGPYVQEGVMEEGSKVKPRMASLLAGMGLDSVDLQTAVLLLSLPRTLGVHPETGEEIIASNGRFGPYVKSGAETRSLPAESLPIYVTLDEAVEILKKPKGKRGGRTVAQILKELGKHPVSELALVVKTGKYGPYITDGRVNASVPKDITVETLSLESAVELIDARASKA